ncbi:uncharacterized protein BYT42DRAFT_502423 [Radiomyces spectabilis]|uniref:uncharacterized protein n=1 Tax=Radiomyces spectabilis TaxID=64574 RepID=UPI00221ED531|nr:uncharacterized protein BYT42DRAFT_502423 [Radiomyces spectabilis]KAI8370436.1 hypothetical protein BYT42DRAFT_502423 [Radiomyces spectabilis]
MSEKKILIGPADEEIKGLLSQSGDPLEAIRGIQRDYGLDLPGIEAIYPLLDLCGYSRREIHAKCLAILHNAVVARIRDPSFALEHFYDIFDRTFPYINNPAMQPIPMALMEKFEKHITDDTLEQLKANLTVFEQCPLNIKQRIWKQDEGFFQQQMMSILNEYHHDDTLQALAMNLKPDSYQEVIEISLCSLRVDILMKFHEQDPLLEKSKNALMIDYAMVLMDPVIANFLSVCIVKWLRNSVDEGAPGNLEESINYNAKLLNLAEHAPDAIATKSKIPKMDRDLKDKFWNAMCAIIVEEDDANMGVMEDKDAEVVRALLKKSETARKIFVHYVLDRTYEGDVAILGRCLPFILETLPTQDDTSAINIMHVETYLSFFRTLVNILAKRHLLECVADRRWRRMVVEEFLLQAVAWDSKVHLNMSWLLGEYFNDPKNLVPLGEQVATIADWADQIFIQGRKDDKVRRKKQWLNRFWDTLLT